MDALVLFVIAGLLAAPILTLFVASLSPLSLLVLPFLLAAVVVMA